MSKIDWTKLIVGDEDWGFLLEVCIRTILMYFVILGGLRLLGKRGVRQLSVFELVVIISLGSAAGDPMFYKEIGLMIPVAIFSVIVAAYRLTTFLTAKSKKIDDFIEGTPTYLIEDGEFSIEECKKETLAQDEFFSELRQQGVSHLGQVKIAILETSGSLSVYFYPDESVKYGLPILPKLYAKADKNLINSGSYACAFCGNIEELQQSNYMICDKCGKDKWVAARNDLRIR